MNIVNKFESSFRNEKSIVFNVKSKIYLWFLNKFVAKEDEYYSFVEPQQEWMILHNKKFWIQPYCEEVLK